jgi:hypothetical protein
VDNVLAAQSRGECNLKEIIKDGWSGVGHTG